VRALDPHAALIGVRPLAGGVSAQTTALELALADGHTRTVVVRRHGAADLARNPQIAADEFRLLQHVHAAGIPVPMPYYYDQSASIFSTPCVVIEYITGATDDIPSPISARTQPLAATLAQIHAVDPVNLTFLPKQIDSTAGMLRQRSQTPDPAFDEARIRSALDAIWPIPLLNCSVLLHGDYWTGNILWRAGELVAVLDWEDAAIGDPLADLGNTRLELLWAWGADAMLEFTRQYAAITAIDTTYLPYWDLCAVLRSAPQLPSWGLDPQDEIRMRGALCWFIEQAFTQVAAVSS
jgi:aminoglycoside phosphotransferase (APT) family kinase protein